jgi:PAS domain S-box-containing protein
MRLLQRHLPDIGGTVLLAALYILTARLGLSLGAIGGVATAVWPPTGLSLAALLLFGYRLWPGVACGALLANLSVGVAVQPAFGIATGNTLEALCAIYLLHRLGFRNSLERVRDVASLVGAAALLSTVVSATIGVSSAVLGGMLPLAESSKAWFTWWVGDAVANLVVAPVLLAWSRRPLLTLRPVQYIELLAFLLSLAIVCRQALIWPHSHPVVWTAFPIVVWAALRFGQQGTTALALLLSVVAVASTTLGKGPFAEPTLDSNLRWLQLFLAGVSFTGLLLAAVLSERRQAEAELRESEARFSTLIESGHDAIVLLDAGGRITYASPSTARLNGYRLPVGTPGIETVHPDDRHRMGRILAELLETPGHVAHAEFRMQRADGSCVWVDGTGTNLLADHRVGAIVVNYHDITPHREALTQITGLARQAAAAEAHFRALYKGAPTGIMTCDHRGRILSTNAHLERMFGYADGELVGALVESLIPQRFREAHAGYRTGYQSHPELRAMGIGRDLMARRKDGTEFPVEIGLSPVRTDNQLRVVAHVTDISVRKQVEAALHAVRQELQIVADTMAAAITRCSRDLRYTWVSKAYAEWLGLSPEDIAGHPIVDVLGDEAFAVISPYIRRVLSGEHVRYERAVNYHTIGLRWIDVAYTPTFDAAGSVDGWVAVVNDVTARREIEEALTRARSELELRVTERTAELRAANDALETEITERSEAQRHIVELSGRLLVVQDQERRRLGRDLHDSVAQYLAGVTMNLALLEQWVAELPAAARAALAQSLRLAEESLREVRTISYLLHPPLLDEVGLASAVGWYVDGFVQRSGIRVDVQVSPTLARLPQDVELALFRIVQEGLTNVHRHSRSPTAHIEILQQRDTVILRITDQGTGMPVTTLSNEGELRVGLGVGIAGMRERLRQLGGQLRISSSEAGTTVIATLPIAVVAPPGQPDAPPAARS